MAMGTPLLVATALASINILLLVGLTIVWLRNYRTFGSTLILGLVAFGAVMLIENAVAIYFFFSMEMLYGSDPTVQATVVVLRALQFIALVFLTYVTMQ